ncbi:MAG: GyrI-like domain-containing protein [Phycisphaerae bacterium]|nr:GyrI-like domain-containing protein [Phycisphaerae bacterium]
MSYIFRLKKAEPLALMAIRTISSRGALAHTLETSFETVWRRLNQLESVTVGPAIAVYFACDDDTLDVAAGFPVKEQLAGDDRLERIELPAASVATTIHEGAYSGIPQAHDALIEWIAGQNLAIAGPAYEVYWVDPSQAKNEGELRTEIVIPVT